MKPKDLSFFYKFNDRRPLIKEGVLSVPIEFSDHYEGKEALFQNKKFLEGIKRPVALEICSGNGTWIVEKAMNYPDIFWIAVEKQFRRVRKIWSKMKNRNINNLFIVSAMAEDFLEHYLSEPLVDQIYVNFPDPWPKKRHAKNRLLKKAFFDRLATIAKKGSHFQLVTDSKPYLDETIETVLEHSSWHYKDPEPFYLENLDDYGDSFFKALWEAKGRKIFHLKLDYIK